MPMQNESQIVLYQPDDSIRLEVKIDAGNETVWLNRNQIAELFGRDVKTIGKHINNALREELATETETNVSDVNKQNNPTVAKFATVQIEGGREVTRQVEYYNLDVILSVGYRVKSNRGQSRSRGDHICRAHWQRAAIFLLSMMKSITSELHSTNSASVSSPSPAYRWTRK